MPTYRTNGAWGSGIGVNLTPAQVDANFYELRSDLDDVIANPPTANSIETISASGFTWTVTLTDGTELAPLPVPVVYTVWRGDWTPLTLYSAADLFRVDGQGIYAVLQDHTSAATFDPDAAAGSPLAPLYTQLIGVATVMGTLDDLSDVTITGAGVSDFLVWTGSEWANQTPAVVRGLLTVPTDLDDLADVAAPSPTLGQVLTWTGSPASWQPQTPASPASALDDLTDVSVPAPGDGDVLTYQAGSPTGWIAAAPAAVPSTLDSLTDVVAPTPAGGDLLQFDGADWVNAAGSAVSDLAAATAPFTGSGLLEVSEPAGSPISYTSKQITVDDLFNTRTIAGTWTLPGSGQISSSGDVAVGAAPSARFSVGGTYTTSGINLTSIAATFSSSSTATHSLLSISATATPSGASVAGIRGFSLLPTIGAATPNLPVYIGNISNATVEAGYAGTIDDFDMYRANGPTFNGAAVTNWSGFRSQGGSLGGPLSSGTRTNRQFYNLVITCGSSGATVNNRGHEITVPSGGASAGTVNNRGIYITGDGGVATGSPPGTVNNFAIFSDSAAASQFAGSLLASELQQVGTTGGVTAFKSLSENLVIAAAAFTDTTIQIPANALVIAVSVRSNVAIPTAATYDVGVSGATTRYATGVSDAVGTTAPGTLAGLLYYATATAIRITPNATPASNSGRVRVSIRYIEVTPPTS